VWPLPGVDLYGNGDKEKIVFEELWDEGKRCIIYSTAYGDSFSADKRCDLLNVATVCFCSCSR
jgi:hypothetical protein